MAPTKPNQHLQPQDILAGHTPEIQALAQALRRLILDTLPDATEKANPGWHAIGYSHPAVGYFCAIFPKADRVDLGFEFGALLPDPSGMLQGTGKQVRYLIIEDGRSLPVGAVRGFLQAAVNLPGDRQIRTWLIENTRKHD